MAKLAISVFLLVLAGQTLLEGQHEPAPPTQSLDRAAAVIMGQAIPHSEVQKLADALKEKNPDESEANLYWFARRSLAERTLLIETAKIYSADISREEVIRFFKYVYEIEEKDVEDGFEEFRDQYLIRTYLDCRMGLSERLKGVSPDFADFIRVTPGDIKEAYREYKETTSTEPKIEVAQFLFPKAAFSQPAQLEDVLNQCREALKNHPADQEKLKALAARWPDCIFLVNDASALQDKIEQFALAAETGRFSAPIDLEKGVVVAYVLNREEVKLLDFKAYQAEHMQTLKMRKRNMVQQFIIDSLIQQADYSPKDLFKPASPRQQPSGDSG